MTVRCLRNTVPASVTGVAFLSGGQGDEEATAHLNAMNVIGRSIRLPWKLTFSYARALQNPAMETWRGDASKVEAARRVFLHRAKMNSAASLGQYKAEMEREAA
jgi:fructose-bisphosphate aldolase class I